MQYSVVTSSVILYSNNKGKLGMNIPSKKQIIEKKLFLITKISYKNTFYHGTKMYCIQCILLTKKKGIAYWPPEANASNSTKTKLTKGNAKFM